MRFPAFALGGLLLAAFHTHAQTTPAVTPAAPRFYVGLGAYSSYYQPIGHPESGYTSVIQSSSFRLPVQLTAGYQLNSRLAVQVGVAYSGANSHYGQTYVYSTPTPGTPSPYYTTEGNITQRQTSVSALARYTLTANPAHRLQFDALGGFTLEHLNYTNQGTQTDNYQSTPTTHDYDSNSTHNTLLLTGGVGARYRLSRRFELTYDFTVNRALNNGNTYGGSNTSNTLTTGQALGLRYRFGR